MVIAASALAADESLVMLAREAVPAGAELEQFRPTGTDAVIPFNNGAAFVYNQGGVLTLGVLPQKGGAMEVAQLPGAYLAVCKYIAAPISVRTLAAHSKPLLVVMTADSASLGGYLTVLSEESGSLQPATAGVIAGSQFEIECVDSERDCRILAQGRWTERVRSWVEVFEWHGGVFARTDRDLDHYMLRQLDRLAAEATAVASAEVPMRAVILAHVVPMYLERGEFDRAITACKLAISRYDEDDSKALRSSARRREDTDQLLRLLPGDKAAVMDLLGTAYRASGREAEAVVEFERAARTRGAKQ
jgi:hypothetical protein